MDLLYVLLTGFISVVLINNLVFNEVHGDLPVHRSLRAIDMAFGWAWRLRSS